MENLRIELDREEDGRWIAEAPDYPGAMAYGNTQQEACCNASAIVGSLQIAQEFRLAKN